MQATTLLYNGLTLAQCCNKRDIEGCKFLLENGADVHENNEEAMEHACIHIGLDRFCGHSCDKTVALVRLLLDYGAHFKQLFVMTISSV